MNWFALVLLGVMGAVLTAACLAYLMALNRFRQRHRVDPATATDAPMTWLADPRAPARLHRRLVKVGHATTLIADRHAPRGRSRRKREADPIREAALELRQRAVAVDAHVARLAVLPPAARKASMGELSRQIQTIENACVRLVELSTCNDEPVRLTGEDGAVEATARRIDHLAEAHRELLALDDDAGLRPERTVAWQPHESPTMAASTPPPPLPDRRTARS
ncbi:MAG: hypothetical protein KDB02_08840 [Acidimicrobiales bacterium]|nr:hypothetical protein [Acidimicrobiales bacterium]